MHDTSAEVTVPTATTVLRPGFRRGERVLRPAMVGVLQRFVEREKTTVKSSHGNPLNPVLLQNHATKKSG